MKPPPDSYPVATGPPSDIGVDHTRQNGSFCRVLDGTWESGLTALWGGKGSEQVLLLAVRAVIGWVSALLRHRREGAHQLQGTLAADKNLLQFLTAGATALDGADPIGFRIEHRMAHALAMPFHYLNFQHFQAIIPPFWHIRLVQNSAEANKAQLTLQLLDERTLADITMRRLVASAQLVRALGGGRDVSQLPKK
jgi:hypothetical protein